MLRSTFIAAIALMATIIFATAVPSFILAARLTVFGTQANGNVVSHTKKNENSADRIPMLYPVVEFSHNGKDVRFTEETGQRSSVGRLSGNVPVLFDAASPGRASVSTFSYLWYDCLVRFLCSCLLYTSPSPRDKRQSRMPSSA